VKVNNMSIPPIVAHGALGIFDELLFIGVAVTFLVMMGISWWMSRRNAPPEESKPLDEQSPESTTQDERYRLH